MEVPENLHSQEYYDQLRVYRDEALVRSNSFGRRWKIGSVTCGAASAQWHAENDGIVWLTEEGISFRGMPITKSRPTRMWISEVAVGNSGLTDFRMDLDHTGSIDVYRTIVTDPSYRSLVSFELAKLKERKYELDYPTDSDRVRLFEEMERGASGLYAFNSLEDE